MAEGHPADPLAAEQVRPRSIEGELLNALEKQFPPPILAVLLPLLAETLAEHDRQLAQAQISVGKAAQLAKITEIHIQAAALDLLLAEIDEDTLYRLWAARGKAYGGEFHDFLKQLRQPLVLLKNVSEASLTPKPDAAASAGPKVKKSRRRPPVNSAGARTPAHALLVQRLCTVYAEATGKRVTHSDGHDDGLPAEPRSPAGRFVRAVIHSTNPEVRLHTLNSLLAAEVRRRRALKSKLAPTKVPPTKTRN